MTADPKQDIAVLDQKNDLADEHDAAELLEIDKVLGGVAGVELGAYDSEGDHHPEMQGFAHPFEDGVDTEADVVESDLQPVEPEQCKEADVRFDSYISSTR